MKVNREIIGRFSAAIALGAFWLFAGFMLRLVLLIYSAGQIVAGPVELIKVFAAGLVFDAAVAGQGLLPLLLYLAAVPRRFFNTRWNKAFILLIVWSSAAGLLLLSVTEAYFWAEFQARFNFIAVDYLVYTQELLGMIREGYPVKTVFAGIAAPGRLTLHLI